MEVQNEDLEKGGNSHKKKIITMKIIMMSKTRVMELKSIDPGR